MENINKTAGERLKLFMEKRGFNESSFATEVGVNRSNVSRWCKGQQIRGANLKKVLEVLQITPTDLFGDSSLAKKPSIHDSLKFALAIPEDIFEIAQQYGSKHEVWEDIRKAFDIYEMTASARDKKKSKKA